MTKIFNKETVGSLKSSSKSINFDKFNNWDSKDKNNIDFLKRKV